MPTTIIESIGSAGRDYSTIAAWESATDNDLVAADEVRIGELYDDSGPFPERANFVGAVTDSTRYRWLRAAAGHEYDPVTDTGAKLERTQQLPAGIVNMREAFGRISHFGVESLYTGTGTARVVFMRNPDCSALGIVAIMKSYTGTLGVCFANNTDKVHIQSCIAIGATGGDGATHGYLEQTTVEGGTIENCLAVNITNSPGRGYDFEGTVGIGITASYFENNAAVGCTDSFDWRNAPNYVLNNNAGHESSAGAIPGANPVTSLVGDDEFLDFAGQDFRLLHDAQLVDAGTTNGHGTTAFQAQSFEDGVDHGDASGTENIGPFDARYIVHGTGIVPLETSSVATLTRTLNFGTGIVPLLMGSFAALTVTTVPELEPGDVIRYSKSDYAAALLRLLPPGKIFTNPEDTYFADELAALACELHRLQEASNTILKESDPRFADLTLPEWEFDYGLPGPCDVLEATADQRRVRLVNKAHKRSGMSATALIEAASVLGYAIALSNHLPFRAGESGPDGGSYSGDKLTQDEWAHVIDVYAPAVTVREFKSGIGKCNEPLRVWTNTELECALNELKHAHVLLRFFYGVEPPAAAIGSLNAGTAQAPAVTGVVAPTPSV